MGLGDVGLPRSERLRPRYESASVHPMPSTGLRGVNMRGDFGSDEPVLCDESDDSDEVDVPDEKLIASPLLASEPPCTDFVGDGAPFWCTATRRFVISIDMSEALAFPGVTKRMRFRFSFRD